MPDPDADLFAFPDQVTSRSAHTGSPARSGVFARVQRKRNLDRAGERVDPADLVQENLDCPPGL